MGIQPRSHRRSCAQGLMDRREAAVHVARSASINNMAPVVAGGMVFMTSGHSSGTAMPDNVLLGFSVDGK